MTNRGRPKTHGMTGTKIYVCWQNMKKRVENTDHKSYPDYGGRGITIVPRWLKFENFYADMGERPQGLTLDRTNNDGPYCKENCRWATRQEQTMNRRPLKNNTSGVVGVYWNKQKKRWRAHCFRNGKDNYLGYYEKIEDATNAVAVFKTEYDQALPACPDV